MNIIKVLMINKINDEEITDASVGEIKCNDKMRIKDLIELCEKDKSFKNFEYFDKKIDFHFEKILRAKYGLETGFIDWQMDMDKLLVKKIPEYFGEPFIVIRSHGGIGGFETDIIIGYIVSKVIDFVIKLISKVYVTYGGALRILENETGQHIEYITDVISINNEWPKGFISNNSFKRKSIVEKRIMKKHGYRLNGNNWRKNYK